jgi:hypothetical protein
MRIVRLIPVGIVVVDMDASDVATGRGRGKTFDRRRLV